MGGRGGLSGNAATQRHPHRRNFAHFIAIFRLIYRFHR